MEPLSSSPPSWSWASIGSCGISWPGDLKLGKAVNLAEVMHVSCTPSTTDDKGMVSGGQATLRGSLTSLMIQYTVGVSEETEQDTYRIIPTDDMLPRWGTAFRTRSQGTVAYGEAWADFNPDILLSSMRADVPPGSVIYFLPLRCSKGGLWSMCKREPEGLFLRQLPGCSKRAEEKHAGITSSALYERVGWGSITFFEPVSLERGSPSSNPYAHVGVDWDTFVTIE